MRSQSSISRSSGGSLPPTFHVPTHTLRDKYSSESRLKELRNSKHLESSVSKSTQG